MNRLALRSSCVCVFALLAACGDDGAAVSSNTTDTDTSSTTDDPSTTLTTADTSESAETTDTPSTTLTTADTSGSESSGPDTSESGTSTDAESSSSGPGESSSSGDESSSSGGGAVCDNGAIEDGEVCDGDNLAGESCISQNFDAGALACADGCATFDTSACVNFSCGNDAIEGKEVCDGTDLDNQNCALQGFDDGVLGCADNCGAFDVSGCYACGDGLIAGPEVCDGAELADQTCASQGFTEGPLACAADCATFDTTACTTCGDDVAEGNEICDGNDLEGNTCQSEGFTDGVLACAVDCGGLDTSACTTCGDGNVEGNEQCDGANLNGENCVTQGGDFGTLGCDNACGFNLASCIFVVDETEPNDDTMVAVATNDFSAANANGPFTVDTFYGGAINPAGDDDIIAVTNVSAGWAALGLETFGGGGPGTCDLPLDTFIEIRTAANVLLASNDDNGINNCSLLQNFPLAPGETVYVRVIEFGDNELIASYYLDIQIDPVVCGNGVAGLGEQCDDGANGDGDGCSDACVAEAAVQEIEPNGTNAEADATGLVSTGSTLFGGSILPIGDVDRFRLDLAAPQFVRFESFASINDCASGAIVLRLFDAAGAPIISDTINSGIALCSAIVFPLPAGTFYVQVEEQGNNAVLPTYLLEVQNQADLGIESEPNEDIANADNNIAAAGSEVYVFGDHLLNIDSDFYAIDIPVAGSSLRLEMIEGDRALETCESNGIDSRLTLFSPLGAQLVDDDDDGRGFCSKVDGTGSTGIALDAAAHDLAAGTYYVQVRASAGAQLSAAGQFTYRLVATVRQP